MKRLKKFVKNHKHTADKLTDRELVGSVCSTQLLLYSVAIVIALFVFNSFEDFFDIFHWDTRLVVVKGVGVGVILLLVDFVLSAVLPEKWLDDGGMNERMFRSLSILQLIGLVLLISFVEELLFRGVIQTTWGLVTASVVFALIHIRYLDKIFLFFYVVAVSFVLGYMYEVTGSLFVTITIHFLVDFVAGLSIIVKNKGKR